MGACKSHEAPQLLNMPLNSSNCRGHWSKRCSAEIASLARGSPTTPRRRSFGAQLVASRSIWRRALAARAAVAVCGSNRHSVPSMNPKLPSASRSLGDISPCQRLRLRSSVQRHSAGEWLGWRGGRVRVASGSTSPRTRRKSVMRRFRAAVTRNTLWTHLTTVAGLWSAPGRYERAVATVRSLAFDFVTGCL